MTFNHSSTSFKGLLVVGLALLAAGVQANQLLFQDGFDIPDNTNLNASISTRTGGTMPLQYLSNTQSNNWSIVSQKLNFSGSAVSSENLYLINRTNGTLADFSQLAGQHYQIGVSIATLNTDGADAAGIALSSSTNGTPPLEVRVVKSRSQVDVYVDGARTRYDQWVNNGILHAVLIDVDETVSPVVFFVTIDGSPLQGGNISFPNSSRRLFFTFADENGNANAQYDSFSVTVIDAGTNQPGKLMDLSQLTNLADELDDTAAFTNALALAGEGGGIFIPSGKAILSQPVQIRQERFTLLGSGAHVSSLVFSNSAFLAMTSTNASISIRDLGFQAASGTRTNLLELRALAGGRLTLRDAFFSTNGGTWSSAVYASGFDDVTLNEIEIKGAGAASTGLRFAGRGHAALLTNLQLDDLGQAILFEDTFAYIQMMRLEMKATADGVVLQATTNATKLQLGESLFDQCTRPVSILAPATFTVFNCRFLEPVAGTGTEPDLLFNRAGIGGTVSGNDFGRGVYCQAVDRVGISGNIFRNGFKYTNNVGRSHVVSGTKILMQLEGNVFITKLTPSILSLQTNGSVLVGQDQPLSTTGFDVDGDRQTDADEMVAGTDWNNPGSYFHIAQTQPLAGGGISFSFDTVSGRTYTILSSDNLTSNLWATIVSGIAGNGLPYVYNSPTGTNRFYKVKVVQNP